MRAECQRDLNYWKCNGDIDPPPSTTYIGYLSQSTCPLVQQ